MSFWEIWGWRLTLAATGLSHLPSAHTGVCVYVVGEGLSGGDGAFLLAVVPLICQAAGSGLPHPGPFPSPPLPLLYLLQSLFPSQLS